MKRIKGMKKNMVRSAKIWGIRDWNPMGMSDERFNLLKAKWNKRLLKYPI